MRKIHKIWSQKIGLHTDHVSCESHFIALKNNHNNTNLIELLEGLEIIRYVKCLEHSRCSITFSSYDRNYFYIFSYRYNQMVFVVYLFVLY